MCVMQVAIKEIGIVFFLHRIYTKNQGRISVNATCGKCDAPLVDDILKLEDGSSVQISTCPWKD